MRTMLKFSLPVERANKAIQDGSLPKTLQSVIEQVKPEAAYFFTENGKRSGCLVFDLKETSQIPAIAERLFMGLDASVDFVPVMNADELMPGLDKIRK